MSGFGHEARNQSWGGGTSPGSSGASESIGSEGGGEVGGAGSLEPNSMGLGSWNASGRAGRPRDCSNDGTDAAGDDPVASVARN